MGRRKKEPGSVHRERIASAAQELFAQRGIAATTMDDIAKAAGYSKATLYVYFKSKEDIVSVLVLKSMKLLDDCLTEALSRESTAKARYVCLCEGLVRYQEEFPFYFDMVLDTINVDFDEADCPPEDIETYRVGEEINRKIEAFLAAGVESGELRGDVPLMPTIFAFWGMLSGVIRLAANKEDYLERTLGMAKRRFLEHGFRMLYASIAKEG